MTSPKQEITIDARLRADHGPIESIAANVARKWTASFGLGASETANGRLKALLVDGALTTLAARAGIVDFESALDDAACRHVTGWLEHVLCEAIASSSQGFSAARLAFLAANSSGEWSDRFLDRGSDHAALRAAMQAAYFVATPPPILQQIERQSL